MCTFYSPKGEVMENKEEFIRLYSNIYYYTNRLKGAEYEKSIYEILIDKDDKNICKSKESLKKCLEWKTGGKFNGDELQVYSNNSKININEVIKAIKNSNISEPEDFIKNLLTVNGIAHVYAITLLFFASNGEYPIFDRFAYAALKAIENKNKIRTLVPNDDTNILTNGSENAHNIYKAYKEYYIKRIEGLFGESYKTDRRIDQALWAYGHMFNLNENDID